MSHPDLFSLTHPYDRLEPVPGSREALRKVAQSPGTAVLWHVNARRYRAAGQVLLRRPGGLALIAILPDVSALRDDREIVHAVHRCRPHGLLPWHEDPSTHDLSEVLRRPPVDLPMEVTDYLAWRGITMDLETTRLVRKIIELSGQLRSITAVSRALYLSRRALGRRFMTRGLPVPSHWLQFGRVLRLSVELQNSDESIASVAFRSGYPDGFSFSNQMHRLVGFRPSQVRDYLGWEWIMEAWLRREAEEGGLAPTVAREVQHGERAPDAAPRLAPTRPRRGRAGSTRSRA